MTTRNSHLVSLHQAVRRHLEEGIIPFWLERAMDSEYGGFLTNFDEEGRSLGTPEKYLNTQCRLLWWFSRLYRKYPNRKDFADLARGGLDFLVRFFWEPNYGGWRWKVKRDGSPLDDGKVVYGQSFAVYALSEYHLATGDTRGLEYAGLTFDLLQKYCADTLRGGYYENLEPDWAISEAGFHGGDRKGLDTHMHLMEAFTTLYATSGKEIHRRKLLEVTDLILRHMVNHKAGCGRNQFDLDFHPIPAIPIRRTWNAEREGEGVATPTDTTSYGHNVELAWLMGEALRTAGADLGPCSKTMHKLLIHAVEHGVDWEFGGIYRDGTAEGEPIILDKEFWQNAEAMVGFLEGYELFGDEKCLKAFEAVWRFVQQYLIVPGVGEWRTLVDRRGKPIDENTGNPWKVAYHTGRSMIECTDRLQRLIERTQEKGFLEALIMDNA